MAELVFFCGTMDCGKSTLALQVDHTHASRGRDGLVWTSHDRAGARVISSRLGLAREAREVTGSTDFWAEVVHARTHGRRVQYLVCDEAQFYSPAQVEQLARLVDDMGVDVFAFGFSRTSAYIVAHLVQGLWRRTRTVRSRSPCPARGRGLR